MDMAQPLERQGDPFQQVQDQFQSEVTAFFQAAERELQALEHSGLPAEPGRGPLRSLVHRRQRLELCLNKPPVPIDYDAAERALRPAVIWRLLTYGTRSERGAEMAGLMLSIYETLRLANQDPLE